MSSWREMRLSTRLWIILALLFALDGMVTTPIALAFVPGAYEANPGHAAFYRIYGLPYFYVSCSIIIALSFFALRGFEDWNKAMCRRFKVKKKFANVLIVLLRQECVTSKSNFARVAAHGNERTSLRQWTFTPSTGGTTAGSVASHA